MSKDQIKEFKKFGYFDPQTSHGNVQMNYQQMVSGFPVGIVYIDDTNYPMVPGNVNNASSYDFPVILRTIPNMTQERVFAGDPTIADDIIAMGQYLIQKEGIRALSSGCGFFGNFQKEVAAALDIPVAMSPLVMIPWIRRLIKPNQKIGVLTANAGALTDKLFDAVGVSQEDREMIIIRDLYSEPEFSCIMTYRGFFDNDGVCNEVVGKAMEIMEEDAEIGAFLLECSDMPPYAYAIQAATQRPVFDFISMIKFLKMSVTQKAYCGWI
ncbi:MAG: aspartate/glutamate racemase family protein [Firmicutes bacterium]|nr:aspartate/glutamate racemase family protein [Bacillota bacterium]MBR2576434.1 aspartate/glutamate racemase family protein [Bacillota bacterium]